MDSKMEAKMPQRTLRNQQEISRDETLTDCPERMQSLMMYKSAGNMEAGNGSGRCINA